MFLLSYEDADQIAEFYLPKHMCHYSEESEMDAC